MSYSRATEKKYLQPQPPGLKGGKPGSKTKGSFEKEMIDKASKTALKEDKNSEST